MSDKALGMLKHMRRQIFGHPAPYVEVRGAALSIGVNPGGSECDDLVDELLQAGYIRTYPSPSLTAHGLYRITDRGIAAAQEGLPHSATVEAQEGVGCSVANKLGGAITAYLSEEEQRESPETVEAEPDRAQPRSDAPGPQEGAQRRPWWRRLFGG